MTQLMTVIRFELNSYAKNKSYIIATIMFTLVLSLGLCIPRFLIMTGVVKDKNAKQEQSMEPVKDEDRTVFLVYDPSGIIKDTTYLEKNYPEYKFEMVSDQKTLEDKVNEESVDAGAVITGPTTFDYIVKNSHITDEKKEMFTDILSYYYRNNYMKENKIDADKLQQVIDTPVVGNQKVLGKDSVANYGYTYVFVFAIYMMIIIYGQMMATSVTSEKSNRAIEVLVTSSKPEYLIFGKVIAGTIASILQITIILGAAIISYNCNAKYWDGMLDIVFTIPVSVLVVFGVFLIFGFLFYSFLYASLGALVSKTEDISKSIGPVMTIFVVGFMIAIFGLNDPDGILVRVTSFIPFTSCYTMFIRASMGTVSIIEIIISAVILIVSSVLVGIIGAKVYRMGTLHYGNPIKISKALSIVFKEKE